MLERRAYKLTELRAIEDDKQMRVVGHAAVFDQLSEELWGFRETIKPGAFAKTIKKDDVRALWNHDPNFVLGRNRSGTLKLREDDKGLVSEIDFPDTPLARGFFQSIKRGDVDQMSFGFQTITDQWRTVDGGTVRELVEVDLFDVSPVTFPAYPQTDVSARSFYEARMKAALEKEPSIALDLAEMRSAQQKQRQEFLDSRRPILKPGDDGYLAEIIRKAHRA